MLSSMRSGNVPCVNFPQVDERWNRNMKDDMKKALDLLWQFKESLDQLHPDCTSIIEKMLQCPQYR